MKVLRPFSFCCLCLALAAPRAFAQTTRDILQPLPEPQSSQAPEPASPQAQRAQPPQAPGSAALGGQASRFSSPSAMPPTFGVPPSPEQQELLKITAENQIADQKLKMRLQKLLDEKEELRAQYELFLQKQRNQLTELEGALGRANLENRLDEERRKADNSKLEAEYQKFSEQNKLSEERYKAETAKQNQELQRLGTENKLAVEKSKRDLDELSRSLEKLKLSNDVKNEEQRTLQIAADAEKRAMDLALKRIEFEERKLQFDKQVMDSRMAKLKSDLELRDKKEDWKKAANTDPVYLAKPFQDGRLVISDRRISLNGPIFTGVADYVTERIHYYNNISTEPVFIVIDRCPGGSVMEGYRIIKAMQASRAPVHVVVKSFAASMAAVITTMADHSYVYPNAIVLHHQMSTFNWGNMTQLKEQLDLAKEWERRLHVPVAQKMGISIEDFRKKMYEKNSDGDWQEFGDKAVGYKWAGSVVQEIDETGFIKNPDAEPKPAKQMFHLDEKTDEKGARYVTLPRLDPFDFYFIYNPDRYYR